MFSVILYDIILVYSTIFIDIADELKKAQFILFLFSIVLILSEIPVKMYLYFKFL